MAMQEGLPEAWERAVDKSRMQRILLFAARRRPGSGSICMCVCVRCCFVTLFSLLFCFAGIHVQFARTR